MGKKLIIFSILSFACLGLVYAAVENIKVSGDINLEGIARDLSLGGAVGVDAEQFALSQVRLRFDADLTENVSAVVRLINERVWGASDEYDVYSDNDQIMLDLGYVELKEFLYQPLTLTIGRQELKYGNGLIVGDPDTNSFVSSTDLSVSNFADLSLRKSFDAVKAVLDFSPWTLDLVYAKVFEEDTNGDDDVTLVGGQLSYKWNSYNGVTEAYFWTADNNRNGATYGLVNEEQPEENQATTYVVGGRVQLNPVERLLLSLEGAYQFGDVYVDTFGYQHLSAWAGQLVAEYSLDMRYTPKIGLMFSYLSGDDDKTDKKHNGWDPLFEDQSAGEIINILFPNSNSMTIKAYGSMKPREDITLGLAYIYTKLAQRLDGTTYTPPISVWSASENTYSIDRNESYLGSEIDAYALYDYTEDVQIKLSGAWFIPGDFFRGDNDDVAYSLRAGIKVTF